MLLRQLQLYAVGMTGCCVHTEDISYEDAVEIGLLEHLCKLNPVIYVGKPPRLVVRMSPETRRLVSTAWGHKVSAAEQRFK